VNLPLALLTTLYTNPFTIVPLYLGAYALGALATGGSATAFTHPPEMSGLEIAAWIEEMTTWMVGLGKPLAVGLLLLAGGLALGGYMAVQALWRVHLIRAWRRRQQRKTVSPR
jgi:uncharacterized protein